MGYVVTAPLVIAKSEAGADLYVYKDGPVPHGQTDEWVENHLRDGMIEESDDVADGGKPSARAGVGAWREYAVSQGMDEAEAEGLSKDELRAQYDA